MNKEELELYRREVIAKEKQAAALETISKYLSFCITTSHGETAFNIGVNGYYRR